MDLDRFRASPAGRLLAAGSVDPPYWAFVPHPLPPDLAIDGHLAAAVEDAGHALGELAGLGRIVPYPDLIAHPFVRREAVLSSRIEGTRAEIDDLYAFEAGQPTGQAWSGAVPEADVQEVLNYVHALEYGLDRLREGAVGLDLLRDVHARLMAGVRGGRASPGAFRTAQNWIGRPGSTPATASYVPPPVPEMLSALTDLEAYLQSADPFPRLIRLAFIHYQFEAIHPFRDGNGRVGRLLITFLLAQWRMLPVPLLSLSAFFESHRRAYYDGLLAVSRDGDWRGWVQIFLAGVRAEARGSIRRALRLIELQAEWRRELAGAGASGRLLQLADQLLETPILTVPQAARHLGASYNAAQRQLDKLVQAGILRQTHDAPLKRYEAPAILAVLREPIDEGVAET